MNLPALVAVNGAGYYQMGDEQYHADPAPKPSLSSSIATKLIKETAADAKYDHPRLTPEQDRLEEDEEDTKKFDLGNVAHFLLLGKGPELEVCDFKDWRTKAAQTARNEAFANGLQPCLAKTFERGQNMADAALRWLADDPDNADAFGEDTGQSEVTVLWQEPVFRDRPEPPKMWMRAKLDRLMNDKRRIYDYKTFKPGADPDAFIKGIVRESRDIQDPFYSRGVAALEGCSWEEVSFRWIVQCPEPPYTLSTIELFHEPGKDNSDRAWSYDRSQWAIDEWARCAAASRYPGWTPRTHYVGVPAFAKTSWEMRRQMHEAGLRLLESPK